MALPRTERIWKSSLLKLVLPEIEPGTFLSSVHSANPWPPRSSSYKLRIFVIKRSPLYFVTFKSNSYKQFNGSLYFYHLYHTILGSSNFLHLVLYHREYVAIKQKKVRMSVPMNIRTRLNVNKSFNKRLSDLSIRTALPFNRFFILQSE